MQPPFPLVSVGMGGGSSCHLCRQTERGRVRQGSHLCLFQEELFACAFLLGFFFFFLFNFTTWNINLLGRCRCCDGNVSLHSCSLWPIEVRLSSAPGTVGHVWVLGNLCAKVWKMSLMYFEAKEEFAELRFQASDLLSDLNSHILSEVFVARAKVFPCLHIVLWNMYWFCMSLSPSVVQFPTLFLDFFGLAEL